MNGITVTDVRVQPGDSAFLIDDGKNTIMYDSGFAFTGYEVADKIKSVLGDRKLDYIFLTHSHYDHALGSAYALRYWPEAKVVAGEYAAKIFAKPTAKAVMRDLDNKFAKTCGVTEYEDLIDSYKKASIEHNKTITEQSEKITSLEEELKNQKEKNNEDLGN